MSQNYTRGLGVVLTGLIGIATAGKALQATATSPVPILQKIMGEPGTDDHWSTCELTVGAVTVTHHVGRTRIVEMRKDGIESRVGALIEAAAKAPLKRAAPHAVETVPHLRYTARIASQLDAFTLSFDGKHREVREGETASKLQAMVDEFCGFWTVKND